MEGLNNSPAEDARRNLMGLSLARLTEELGPYIDRPYRVGQIYRALYERDVDSLDGVTELSKKLRSELSERFSIRHPEIADTHRSADGTVKYLFRLEDGATIETVDIPDGRRRTLCISSQAGCALACQFCVTGYWGGGRNLTSGEILSQVLLTRRQPQEGTHGLNLVFMGMGEPLLNLENLSEALSILSEQISRRRITISTAGVIPGIAEMARWKQRPRLAISLHAPDDVRRSQIMPINQRYPLAELLACLAEFPVEPREKLTFEYLLIRDFNEAPEDAERLVEVLAGLPAKVNLIPLNPDPVLDQRMQPPSASSVRRFHRRLNDLGMTATIRKQRGDDVSAACGQLRAPAREPRGFRRSNFGV